VLPSLRDIQFVKRFESLLHTASMKFEFKIWKFVFTNVRFRSWLSKALSVNAALDEKLRQNDMLLSAIFKFCTAKNLFRYFICFAVMTSHIIKLSIGVQALAFFGLSILSSPSNESSYTSIWPL